MANEKRLIDANDFSTYLMRKFGFNPVNEETMQKWLEDYTKQNTVDAVEVVHGEWGEIYTCHGERLWGYRCSQCEADNSEKSNYCPNCGAKMDGGNYEKDS
jgi:rRNA maturation endonuclease Nob1